MSRESCRGNLGSLKRFKLLSEEVHLIYLDHAATAYPRHPGVSEAMLKALEVAGSVGRGGHQGAQSASAIVASCREKLGHLMGASDANRISLFPSSTLALSTLIADLAQRSDSQAEIWMGKLEHNAVWRPAVRAFGDDRVRFLPTDEDGVIDVSQLKSLDMSRAAGVVVQHASNVTGVLQPVEEVGAWCLQLGIPMIVDGAQAAGLVPFSVERCPGLKAYTMAGHKHLGGPPGIGPCYLAHDYEPEPLWIGGNGIDSEHPSVPASGPGRFESGTQNLPGIAGLDAALNFFEDHPVSERFQKAVKIRQTWRDMIQEIPGVVIPGESGTAPRTPVIALHVPGHSADQLSAELDVRIGVRCRSGLQCAPLAHQHLGTLDAGGTLRIAPGEETDGETRELVCATLAKLIL
ncbi:MAG: aminotransferase class V-fold PLP-dependent enzyme [Proteobacteria bacterium]|nr:aminotransferase class V-fold PLP-dependent enzyme [Pseudomonadota bacterium]